MGGNADFRQIMPHLGDVPPPISDGGEMYGGETSPPHIFRRWGGNRFLPPIFPDHGGGLHPPIFSLIWGGTDIYAQGNSNRPCDVP